MHELDCAQRIFGQMTRLSKGGKKDFVVKVAKNHDAAEIAGILKGIVQASRENIGFSVEAVPVKIKCEGCGFAGNVDVPFSAVSLRAVCPSCKSNRTRTVSNEVEVSYA